MITRSKKRTRENLNRLPREVKATLPSWVKCTDPISAETLEEVRSTVMVWATNVYHYFEETKTYYIYYDITDSQEEEYDDDDQDLDPEEAIMILSEGWAMFGGIKNMPPRTVGWSTFIRQIILSDDVNIIHRSKHFDWQEDWDWEPDVKWANIDVVSHKRNSSLKMLGIEVYFHERLSSEIKDEICSKLASALRALKSRISRICGINELERRTQSH